MASAVPTSLDLLGFVAGKLLHRAEVLCHQKLWCHVGDAAPKFSMTQHFSPAKQPTYCLSAGTSDLM